MADERREVEFLWSDVWLLFAMPVALRSGPITLINLLGAADAVEHAVPEREEVNGAIGRLSRAGYVRFEGGVVSVTPEGFALLDRVSQGSLQQQRTALERVLGARPFGICAPQETQRGERDFYSEAEHRSAARRLHY